MPPLESVPCTSVRNVLRFAAENGAASMNGAFELVLGVVELFWMVVKPTRNAGLTLTKARDSVDFIMLMRYR